MDITFQYPPELLNLLIEAIPKLCRSKPDLLMFFQGSGVGEEILRRHRVQLAQQKELFKKHVVTREVLTELNAKGDPTLRERREILRRVTQFEDFSVCWENDQPAARGLVAQIRDLVNVRDSFTRMNQERQRERDERLVMLRREQEAKEKREQELGRIREDLFALFGETNPWKRGKALEAVLNRYFAASSILISEAISLKGDAGTGIVEQIDGVVILRGSLFLVEMKWEKDTLGRDKVASHLVRVFNRSLAGGIIISYSDYAPAAIQDCRDALRDKAIVLCQLEELVRTIEAQGDLQAVLEKKLEAAVIHKNPLFRVES
jgi:restriction system protein